MRLRTRYTHRLPTAPGLVLDIPMFEGSGTKVLDVSGKGNHGTIINAVWTSVKNGVAMSFNGTNAYINCGNDASLNITDAITIEVWVKALNPATANYGIVYKGDFNDTQGVYNMLIAAGRVYFRLNENAGQTITPDKVTVSGKWYHIVATYNKANMKIYIDGVEEASTGYTTAISTDANNLQIGRYYGGTTRYFDGTIDEVGIYALALTAEQIKRRYEQTKRDYVRGF